jgi:hypothetical protein
MMKSAIEVPSQVRELAVTSIDNVKKVRAVGAPRADSLRLGVPSTSPQPPPLRVPHRSVTEIP